MSTSDRNILNRSETKEQQRRIKKKQPSRKLCAPFLHPPVQLLSYFCFTSNSQTAAAGTDFQLPVFLLDAPTPHQQLPLTKREEMFLNRTILILCLYDFSFRLSY